MSDTHQSTPESLRNGVGDAFNIYQATFTMVALFIGFVFVAIFELLTEDKVKIPHLDIIVAALVASMMLLAFSMMCFHATAHQVIRYWKIFYPASKYARIGGLLFSLGFLLMFLGISALLWARDLRHLSIIEATASIELFLFGLHIKSIQKNNPSCISVDEPIKSPFLNFLINWWSKQKKTEIGDTKEI